MLNIKGPVRARVIRVGERVTLGVFVEGAWHRIYALTEAQLIEGEWIVGELSFREDQLIFKLTRREQPQAMALDDGGSGLDLEA